MSTKDSTGYFSHDCDARNDEKIIRLRMRHGAAGYGVYFMILERLRANADYTSAKDYNMIAFDLRVDAALIKSVIEDFGLFAFTENGKCFYSESFNRRMEIKDTATQRRREAANRRWSKGNPQPSGGDVYTDDSDDSAPPDAMQMQCRCNADAIHQKTDAIKGKKSKENKIKKKSPDGDTKKDGLTAFEVDEGGDLENSSKGAISSDLEECLRQVKLLAPTLSAQTGFTVEAITATATEIAQEWSITSEYSKKYPATHLKNRTLKRLRSQPSAPPKKPNPPERSSDPSVPEESGPTGAEAYKAFLASKGLPTDTKITEIPLEL